MSFEKLTEKDSEYRHLEEMSVMQLLQNINTEDKKVADAVEIALPQLEKMIEAIVERMIDGGRLFYIGAGTSGRLGILDASECVPTFGVPRGWVVGVIAGGREAVENAVEFAEDDDKAGWMDLTAHDISVKDFVVGLSASGTAPYVIGALESCRKEGIGTGSITCNPGAPLCTVSDFSVEISVGPEFVTGSTRMKSGTAQKMALNMISTAVMILLGKVDDNKMVNMKLSNEKLLNRGVGLIMKTLEIDDFEKAKLLLLSHGNVKKAILAHKTENYLGK